MIRLLAISMMVLFGATVANAAPAAPSGITPQNELLVKVHGGHGKACRWGRVHRWDTKARHRHVGRDVRVCGKRWRGKGRPHHRGCFKIGPVWYCP